MIGFSYRVGILGYSPHSSLSDNFHPEVHRVHCMRLPLEDLVAAA